MWIEKETCIAEIQTLLDNGYEVEVESPDGYVPVNFFINKGMFEEYILRMEDTSYEPVSCNADHLFETTIGWASASQLANKGEINFLTKDGYKKGTVSQTGKMVPIVDINVEHENHRYYTNGISSHNTGVGKSMMMCHHSAHYLSAGYNVLYITMEMAEERIAERIDANLLNTALDDLPKIKKDIFTTKIANIQSKSAGKLIVKQFPTGAAHVGHFRALLNELELKKSFKPDVIMIDYLNICASSRMKMGGSINTYSLVKSIAEELRGLAIEFDVPIWSATQVTRAGFCLDPYTEVIGTSGKKLLKDVKLGDKLLSNEGWNEVKTVFPAQLKKTYKIRTKSGKVIYCSGDHLFPTEDGKEKSIHWGLKVGDKLIVKNNS